MRGDIEKFESGPKIVVYILAAIASIIYLIYRITNTMPFSLRPVDIIIGLIVLAAELIENFEGLQGNEISSVKEGTYLSLR